MGLILNLKFKIMKRAEFCNKMLIPGIACGCLYGINEAMVPHHVSSLVSGSKNETPCDEKMEFTHKWVKRFFDIMDQQIDEKTRTQLMRANGAACAKGAYGDFTDAKPATLGEIDKTISSFQEKIGKENIHREGSTVYFNYVGNGKGLNISDGFCLCPMIENGPEFLSPTYCQCSVGYVGYMFRRYITFKPVDVELLESLRAGGKACRFKVMI